MPGQRVEARRWPVGFGTAKGSTTNTPFGEVSERSASMRGGLAAAALEAGLVRYTWEAEAVLRELAVAKPIFRARDAVSAGVPHELLSWCVRLKSIRRHDRSLYSLPDAQPSRPALALAQAPNARLCLLSALHLHGLIDEPPEVWLGVEKGAHVPSVDATPVRIVRMSPSCFRCYRVALQQLPTFTFERTLAECLKYRDAIGERRVDAILRDALAKGRVRWLAFKNAIRFCRVRRVAAPYQISIPREPDDEW
jgi:hypothetical protein